ncbi:CLEC-50 protein [Aphelenchoides avenae]|nr:CLEC-50 protein [Aphelenchus avenae]
MQGPGSEECYLYKCSQVTWKNAESECVSYGGHLASVPNRTYNALLNRMPNDACASSYWIGGNKDFTVADKWAWVDKSAFSFTNWATGQPATAKRMIFNPATGDWKTAAGSSLRPFICKFPGVSGSTCPSCPSTTPCKTAPPKPICDPGWTFFAKTKKCFKVLKGVATWNQYNVNCTALGGRMGSVTSAEEQAFVLDLARAYVPYGLVTWIGLHIPVGTARWAWADGSSVNYTNWNTGEPNGGGLTGCTHMYTDYTDVTATVKGVWNDNGCNVNGHSALCSKKVDVHF